MAESIKDQNFPNPKQNEDNSIGRQNLYPYYAGYSLNFVRKMVDLFDVSLDMKLLDPWNGSGTTTQVAFDKGIQATGVDLNPTMAIVSRARLLEFDNISQLQDELKDIVKKTRYYRNRRIQAGDPLSLWFDDKSVLIIRQIVRAIQEVFQPRSDTLYGIYNASQINPRAAFFYVILFKILRETALPFTSSNPTWIKRPKNNNKRLSINKHDFIQRFETLAISLIENLKEQDSFIIRNGKLDCIQIDIGTSTSLTYNANTFDFMIGSPPYCTRIDYAIATIIELAVLDIEMAKQYRYLRNTMIGTSTIRTQQPSQQLIWGQTCNKFLNAVKDHASKASRTYYLKTYLQYFSDIYISLCEISRVLKSGSSAIFVIQDSYYKNLHNDLPRIIYEMAESLEWHLENKIDFSVQQTMVYINTKARAYQKQRNTIESVLHFTV